MGRQLTRPRNASIAGASSIAEAEILFSDASQDVVDLPAGAVVTRVWASVEVAFNGTAPLLTVGITGSQEKYLAAADITEGTPGIYPAAGKGPFARNAAAETVKAFFSATTPTTGRARIYIEYVRTAANG